MAIFRPTAATPLTPFQDLLGDIIDSIETDYTPEPVRYYSVADAAARTALVGMRNGDFLYQQDTTVTYRRVAGAWVIHSQGWTDFTPATTNLTLGTGGTTPYAKYRITNGSADVRVGWKLGSAGFTVGDVILTPPVAVNTFLATYPVPLGSASYIDSSAGAGGRYWAPLYFSGTNIRLLSLASASGLMAAGLSTAPFTWAASDEIHIAASFPV